MEPSGGTKQRRSKPDYDRVALVAAAIGATSAIAAGALFMLSRRVLEADDAPRAPALRDGGAHGPVGSSGSIRASGRDAMRDPPREWDRVDEASDQSYPASDPPNLVSHID